MPNVRKPTAEQIQEARKRFKEGDSIRTVAKAVGVSVWQSRRINDGLKKDAKTVAATENAIPALRRQNERLKDMLHKAQKVSPVEFELLLKIEQRLAENIKTIAGMERELGDSESDNEKAALERQIVSLVKVVSEAVDDCPSCKRAIRRSLGALMHGETK